MPKYKGSCGCYNRQDAREIGLVPAIVWNDILDRSEQLDANPMWYDQKDAADRLGMSETTLKRAVDKLVEVGRISKKKGYRPNTTISTTWITINDGEDEFWTSRKSDLTLPRKSDLAVPILKETKERDKTKEVRSRVVYFRVNPSGRAWKSQKVYSTDEEVERLENMDGDEYIDFKHWKSPNWVGDDSKAKFKYMKVKLVQPDVEEEEEEVETKMINGIKCKRITYKSTDGEEVEAWVKMDNSMTENY